MGQKSAQKQRKIKEKRHTEKRIKDEHKKQQRATETPNKKEETHKRIEKKKNENSNNKMSDIQKQKEARDGQNVEYKTIRQQIMDTKMDLKRRTK